MPHSFQYKIFGTMAEWAAGLYGCGFECHLQLCVKFVHFPHVAWAIHHSLRMHFGKTATRKLPLDYDCI